jgi:hypothetical protein
VIRSGDASITERSAMVTEGSIEVRVKKPAWSDAAKPHQTELESLPGGGESQARPST